MSARGRLHGLREGECAEGGDAELAECITLCLDCAALCQTCLPLQAGGSSSSAPLSRICADACDRCARECERTGMTESAEVCRRAAAPPKRADKRPAHRPDPHC